MRCASPARRSPRLPHSTTFASRALPRSHDNAALRVKPVTAKKDHACGEKIVGMRPRRTARPTSPAFEECKCTTSGSTWATVRCNASISRAVDGLGARSASHRRCVAPRLRIPAAKTPSLGHATRDLPSACDLVVDEAFHIPSQSADLRRLDDVKDTNPHERLRDECPRAMLSRPSSVERIRYVNLRIL